MCCAVPGRRGVLYLGGGGTGSQLQHSTHRAYDMQGTSHGHQVGGAYSVWRFIQGLEKREGGNRKEGGKGVSQEAFPNTILELIPLYMTCAEQCPRENVA